MGWKRKLPKRRDALARERAAEILTDMAASIRGIDGALLATLDGYALASTAIDNAPGAAALVASSRGVAERLADLCGGGPLAELVVRSATGYVIVYAAGSGGALTVTADDTANLALIHLRAREVVAELQDLFAGLGADDAPTEEGAVL